MWFFLCLNLIHFMNNTGDDQAKGNSTHEEEARSTWLYTWFSHCKWLFVLDYVEIYMYKESQNNRYVCLWYNSRYHTGLASLLKLPGKPGMVAVYKRVLGLKQNSVNKLLNPCACLQDADKPGCPKFRK